MAENSASLISTLSKKWKLEQIPNKKLEMENKLMEERLNSLKADLQAEKQKRSNRGEGSIWSKGQVGLVTTYAKNVVNPDSASNKDSILNRPSNRAIKLKILKDEAINIKQENSKNSGKEKKPKCGQCEKNLAFTRCLECGEDYCANCFTDFHMKGALQKHRTTSIPQPGKTLPKPSVQEERVISNSRTKLKEPSNISLGMFDNEDEEFMGSLQVEEETAPLPGPGSLLYGTYDEKAAGDSFQQALMQWRNPSATGTPVTIKPAKTALKTANKSVRILETATSKHNASVGTDTSLPVNKAFKELEKHINTNQSMSCAERMLLQKLRREGYSGDTPRSQVMIEEIPQVSKFSESSRIDMRRLMPDQPNNIECTPREDFSEKKRPTSSRPMSSRPMSSRPMSSRPSSSRSVTAKSNTPGKASAIKTSLESNLCRVASPTLKNIGMRQVKPEVIHKEENGLGQFLLLDVEKQPELTTPRTDRPASGLKLSHKFYEMSPRSWHPMNSLVTSQSLPASPAIDSKSKPEKEPDHLMTSSKTLSRSLVTESPRVPKLNLSKSLARHKTFVNTAETKKTTPRKSQRISSAAGSFAASNPLNVELARSFLEFDADDGRSSRLCQNEDDIDYYGQLEVEYKENVHRTCDYGKIDTDVVTSRKADKVDLKDLSANVKKGLELSLIGHEYEHDDLDDDLQLLKSLR